MSRSVRPIAERFWAKVAVGEGCWNWTATPNPDGYGRLKVGDRNILAHRVSWEMAGKSVPGGMQLDHICLNRACVNPDHLRVTTQYENMQNLAGAQSRNKTGIRGVTWEAARGRYRVQAIKRHKRHFGGYFTDLEEAAEAARQLRLSLFTHNEVDRSAA